MQREQRRTNNDTGDHPIRPARDIALLGLKLKTVRTIGDSSLRAMIRDARVRLVFAAIFAHGEGKAG